MRCLPYLASLVLLGGALSSCQSDMQAPALAQAQENGFDLLLQDAKARIAAEMELPLNVPVPKDPGGGYTHEQHKANAKVIYEAGQIYQLTGDKKYAEHAGKLMLAYAQVYPSWELHPAKKEQSPGRMFWQNLNESMWLLNVSQSYAAIKDTLSEEQRQDIETNVLRNMAEFLSDGSPETFNKVHNHGTWATAAVGLTGYAIGDNDYVEQALMGLDKSGEAGFLKQMDKLFSPDGYYNEGPYYQRFALMPFVIFAQEVQKNNPELEIFEKRDGILKKAIYTTIQQNYGGLFFPINDAIKDKGIATRELVHGVAIAYDLTGDRGLLSVAKAQGRFMLTPESRKVATDISAGKAAPFDYKTMRLGDGEDGTQGALDIIRASNDPNDLVLVAKNTSQGLGHGHFDKMGMLLYDAGHEILRDYGAARFLNVEAKYGGHYLRENNSFAKQTIAHNALVVDETSHFGGDTQTGNKHAPSLGEFYNGKNLQATYAEITTAYPDVKLGRVMAMIDDAAFARPIVVDIMTASSDSKHQYDMPFYYNGQLTDTNFKLLAETRSRQQLGNKNGYQHLWKVGLGDVENQLSQVTWLLDSTFYTVTSAVPDNTQAIFVEIGADDPDFNLRRESGFVLRSKAKGDAVFASVIEPHGEYNPTVEYTLDSHSSVRAVEHFQEGDNHYLKIETKNGDRVDFAVSASILDNNTHSMSVEGKAVTWTGNYKVFHSQNHLNRGQ